MNWEQVEATCVASFPLSGSRAPLFAGLRAIADRLAAGGIAGELWVDGSFLTQKMEPGDVDIVLRVEEDFLNATSPSQQSLLDWFGSANEAAREQRKKQFGCDSYVFCELPEGHPYYPGRSLFEYWKTQFGRDREQTPKGIAVVLISGGEQ